MKIGALSLQKAVVAGTLVVVVCEERTISRSGYVPPVFASGKMMEIRCLRNSH